MNIEEKRQEIREAIAESFWNVDVDVSDYEGFTKAYLAKADKIIKWLDSQGVEIIDKEAELPENPVVVTDYLGISKQEAFDRQLSLDYFHKLILHQIEDANFHKHYRLIDE